MSIDPRDAGQDARLRHDRLAKLAQARDGMAAALRLLDDHSRSPAAATLDLAVHHLDAELAGETASAEGFPPASGVHRATDR